MLKSAYPVSYFRNFIFGVEDSLVSTVGLLSGIAAAGVNKETILVTGVVLIFVEAFSMGAGSFISESSADEYTTGTDKIVKRDILSGMIMFVSYFVSGFIPLSSYLIFPVESALVLSIVFSLAALFALGVIGARISGGNLLKNGLRVITIGGIAIFLGLLVGSVLSVN